MKWKLWVVLLSLPLVAFAQPMKEAALPSLAPLVDSVKSAVVNVDVQAASARSLREDEFFERFFGFRHPGGPQGREPLRRGLGSGFIIDAKGLLLTNNHVVEGAVKIRVRLDDGRSFEGEVLGTDPLTDLALVKLKNVKGSLPAVKLGDSGSMRVGDWVLAIGNPFGLASSVSLGIVSALDRNIQAGPYDQFLQTDAAINPGNSGGPLFNLKGEVIGINTAIVGGGSGIGFAVPSNVAKALLPQLEKEGLVRRGWLGVVIQDLTPKLALGLKLPIKEGAIISVMTPNSPAQRSGLKVDDVIVAINGETVSSAGSLTKIVGMQKPDTTVKIKLYRAGKPMELNVRLGMRPDEAGKTGRTPLPSTGQEQKNPRLGLVVQDINPRLAEALSLPRHGALVVSVQPNSPAEEAGLAREMLIVEANNTAIRTAQQLIHVLAEIPSGQVALLRVQLPGREERTFLLALEMP
ncbi:MAG: trypsin-like peptidase domain-containing protein [Cystobacterineae bacterium]|nr:trypsin-like peptidase domain-containing protein [Cystobacterineae bacterium]